MVFKVLNRQTCSIHWYHSKVDWKDQAVVMYIDESQNKNCFYNVSENHLGKYKEQRTTEFQIA